jgi:hypothetical protein
MNNVPRFLFSAGSYGARGGLTLRRVATYPAGFVTQEVNSDAACQAPLGPGQIMASHGET